MASEPAASSSSSTSKRVKAIDPNLRVLFQALESTSSAKPDEDDEGDERTPMHTPDIPPACISCSHRHAHARTCKIKDPSMTLEKFVDQAKNLVNYCYCSHALAGRSTTGVHVDCSFIFDANGAKWSDDNNRRKQGVRAFLASKLTPETWDLLKSWDSL